MDEENIDVDGVVETFDGITTIKLFIKKNELTKVLKMPKPRSEVSDNSDNFETAKESSRSEVSDNSDHLETAKESLHDAVDLQEPFNK
ncbi:GL26768 [Drosophila persimilis]|uniref:GL26768 n=1 Tax=Drosophila persimilis TaxID=7234 RepID=B4H2L8_DROPE|nr:GL26768 [Drosophila persimilis]